MFLSFLIISLLFYTLYYQFSFVQTSKFFIEYEQLISMSNMERKKNALRESESENKVIKKSNKKKKKRRKI